MLVAAARSFRPLPRTFNLLDPARSGPGDRMGSTEQSYASG